MYFPLIILKLNVLKVIHPDRKQILQRDPINNNLAIATNRFTIQIRFNLHKIGKKIKIRKSTINNQLENMENLNIR